MSRLEVKISEVKSLSAKLGPDCTKVSSIADSINSVRGNLDSRITGRRNIGSRLSSAYNEAKSIQAKLKALQKFIDDSMDRYEKAEDKVNKEAEELMFLWSIEYGGEFALEWSGTMYGVPGNSLLNEEIFDDEGIEEEEEDCEHKGGWERIYELEDKYDTKDLETNISQLEIALTGVSNISKESLSDPSIVKTNGLEFKLFRQNGKVYLKILGTKDQDFSTVRELLRKATGKRWNDKGFVTSLSNDGVALYDESNEKFFRKNSSKIFGDKLDPLNDYINANNKIIGKNKWQIAESTASDTFRENMPWNSFKDFKAAERVTKVGKVAGILGFGLTAADDINANFNSKENRSKGIVEKVADSASDITIDTASGAGAMAAGAAIGSVIPGVGTVVGGAIGLVIGVGINYEANNHKFNSLGEKSVVGWAKDEAKGAINSLGKDIDSAGKSINSVGKYIGKIF